MRNSLKVMAPDKKKGFLFVFAALLFLSLSGLLYYAAPHVQSHFDRDSAGYDRIARNFAATGHLADPGVRGGIPIQPIGYPLLLGVLYKVFGPDVRPVIFLQVLLTLVCIGLIFLIAGRLFGSQVAYIALFLSATNLGFLIYAQLLLAETVMLTFLLLFFERLTAFMREQKIMQLLQAGLVLGFSILIKPMALLFIFLLLPFIWFCPCRTAAVWRKLKCVSMLLISFYVPLVGYMAYNYHQYGYFRYAPMTSLNIYQCYLSKVIAAVDHVPVEPVRTQTLAFTGAHGFDEAGWDTGRQLFAVYAHKQPLMFAKVWAINVLKTIFGLYVTQLKLFLNPVLVGGSHSFFKISGTLCDRCVTYIVGGSPNSFVARVAIFEFFWNLVRWLLVLCALVLLVRRRSWCLLYLFGAYTFQCAFVTGIDGCCRYRMTFEPILIMLAAIGIYALYCYWSKKECRV